MDLRDLIHPDVRTVLRQTEHPLIVELGACDGTFTHALLLCCATPPQIYSFEPDPRNVARIHVPLCTHFVAAASGNVTGKIKFYLAHPDHNGAIGSSSISEFKDQTKAFPWCVLDGTVEVDCWRLDDFCPQHGITKIDLLFMDVQGAERLVFAGMPTMLAATRYIWTEYEGRTKADEGTCYKDSSSLERLLEILGPNWKHIGGTVYDALLCNTTLLPNCSTGNSRKDQQT